MTGLTKKLTINLFREFVEHSVIGMVAFDDSGKVIFSNSRAIEILEMATPKDWPITALFPDRERIGTYIPCTEELLRRDGLTSEVLVKKGNGHHFLASLSVRRYGVSAGEGFYLISFQDVTVEKKLSRELRAKQEEIERAYSELLEQNKQLKALDLAKDKFIALTTHELRTPLSAIVATADVLENRLYESEEQKEEFIRVIGEQGRHLMELVNDVLDFAKIRAGKMDFFVESIQLRPLLEKLAGSYGSMAEQERVSIKIDVPDASFDDHAWADLIRLKEVINNVLSNAIKYNRADGTVTVALCKHTEASGGNFLRIAVTDTGVGIPGDKQDSVFNEFETVGHVSKHHKGTGLGMPISKRLMEQMGGRLSFTSNYGHGSTFNIDIPIDKVLTEDFYRSRPDLDSDLAA